MKNELLKQVLRAVWWERPLKHKAQRCGSSCLHPHQVLMPALVLLRSFQCYPDV